MPDTNNHWITNRTLVATVYIGRFTILIMLVSGLLYGFLARLINGEGYLGFIAAIIALLRESRMPVLEEEPRVLTTPLRSEHGDS